MKTEIFSVVAGSDVWSQDGLWNVLFYEGASVGVNTTIRVRSIQGPGAVDVELRPGRQVRLREPVRGLLITCPAGTALTGKISVGAGDIRDSSVMGSVEVIDARVNRTLSGQVFGKSAFQGAGGLGVYSYVGVRNQPGSGKRVRIDFCSFASSGAPAGVNGAIAVDQGASAGMVLAHNKLSGAADSTVIVINHPTATDFLAAPAKQQFYGYLSAVAVDRAFSFIYPVILNPGYTFYVRPSNANTDITGWFDFVEEAA